MQTAAGKIPVAFGQLGSGSEVPVDYVTSPKAQRSLRTLLSFFSESGASDVSPHFLRLSCTAPPSAAGYHRSMKICT